MALPTPTMLEIYRLRKVWEAEHGRPATRFYLHPAWNQPRILPPDGFLKRRGGLEWWADSRLAKDAVRFEGVMDESVTPSPNEGTQVSPDPTPEPEPIPDAIADAPRPADGDSDSVHQPVGQEPEPITEPTPSQDPVVAPKAKKPRVKGRAKAKKAKRMK